MYADRGSVHCIRMHIVTRHLRSNSVRAYAHACVRACSACVLRVRACVLCVLRVHACVRGSWLVARGSWIVARGSWLVARGSWLVARRGSRLVAHACVRACVPVWLIGCCVYATFLHCGAFLHYVFVMQDVFTLRFCVARHFYITFLRSKAFFQYVFALHGVFSLRFHAARRF